MKKRLPHIFTTLFFAMFIAAGCESNNKVNEDASGRDTLVIVQQPAPTDTARDGVQTEESAPPVQPAEPPVKPKAKTTTPTGDESTTEKNTDTGWRAILKEYHEILCRAHKGQGSTEDKIRQAELSRELLLQKRKLSGTELFTFTAEMARAANMETCK